MECPRCNYLMDPFEKECPKCARMGTQAATKVPPAPAPDPQVTAAVNRVAASVHTQAAQQARMARQAAVYTGPPLGLPLTILLWIYIALLGLFLLFFAIGMIIAQSQMSQDVSSQIGGLAIFVVAPLVLCFVAAIAMLQTKKWGFWVFSFFTALPLFSAFKSGNPIEITLNLLFLSLPIAIFILALLNWNEFD